MLTVSYNDKAYKFPLLHPTQGNTYMYGTIDLDTNWRQLEYQNGGHTLNLGATSYFEVPRELFKDLYKSEFFFSEQIMDEIEGGDTSENLPLIYFDLEIGFTKIFDFNTYESVLIGNIRRKFPTFKALENLVLDKAIVADSLLTLSNAFNYEPTLRSIKFGKIKDKAINVICLAEFTAHDNTKGRIEIDIWAPIKLYFEAGVYSDSFPELSIDERLKEIRDCFATVYDISEYELIERVVDEESKRVEIQFINKQWK